MDVWWVEGGPEGKGRAGLREMGWASRDYRINNMTGGDDPVIYSHRRLSVSSASVLTVSSSPAQGACRYYSPHRFCCRIAPCTCVTNFIRARARAHSPLSLNSLLFSIIRSCTHRNLCHWATHHAPPAWCGSDCLLFHICKVCKAANFWLFFVFVHKIDIYPWWYV